MSLVYVGRDALAIHLTLANRYDMPRVLRACAEVGAALTRCTHKRRPVLSIV